MLGWENSQLINVWVWANVWCLNCLMFPCASSKESNWNYVKTKPDRTFTTRTDLQNSDSYTVAEKSPWFFQDFKGHKDKFPVVFFVFRYYFFLLRSWIGGCLQICGFTLKVKNFLSKPKIKKHFDAKPKLFFQSKMLSWDKKDNSAELKTHKITEIEIPIFSGIPCLGTLENFERFSHADVSHENNHKVAWKVFTVKYRNETIWSSAV